MGDQDKGSASGEEGARKGENTLLVRAVPNHLGQAGFAGHQKSNLYIGQTHIILRVQHVAGDGLGRQRAGAQHQGNSPLPDALAHDTKRTGTAAHETAFVKDWPQCGQNLCSEVRASPQL